MFPKSSYIEQIRTKSNLKLCSKICGNTRFNQEVEFVMSSSSDKVFRIACHKATFVAINHIQHSNHVMILKHVHNLLFR